jgi:DNA polymerase-3 subunit epsilon
MQEHERLVLLAIVMPRLELSILIILMAWFFLGLIVSAIYRAYVMAPLTLREQALVLVSANPGLRLQEIGAPEIRTLARVVNAPGRAARSRCSAMSRQRIARAKAPPSRRRKNRLAALMSELTQSVVVCNLDGRILLYNNRARLQFKALADKVGLRPGRRELIGLGRSIFAILERNLITHALENIQQRLARGSQQPVANFVTTSRAGQLIRVQMAPVLAGTRARRARARGPIAGYVLMLDNITRNFEMESRATPCCNRSPRAAAPRSATSAPPSKPARLSGHGGGTARRFVGIVRDEVGRWASGSTATVNEFSDALKARWPLEDMLGEDLIAAAQRRIENRLELPTKVEEVTEGLWVKVDSFSLLQGLTYLAKRLRDEYDIREAALPPGAGRPARPPRPDLERRGGRQPDPAGLGDRSHERGRREQPADPARGDRAPRRRDLVRARKGLAPGLHPHPDPLRPAAGDARHRALMQVGSRPEYYDFNLFRQTEESRALDERLLSELTYTVFDTETTGLEPSAGDEIIQIGATRIVNGRLLRSESIDQLVDPRRPLRPEGIPIHGITEEMVAGQPAIDKALPAVPCLLRGHRAGGPQRRLRHALPAAQGGGDRHPLPPAGARHAAALGGDPSQPGVAQAGGDLRTPRHQRHRPPHRPRRRHRHRRGVPQDDPAARGDGHPHPARGARGGRAHLLRQNQVLNRNPTWKNRSDPPRKPISRRCTARSAA